MSVLVMSLCFRAKFGSPYLKAVALALADHANDEGEKVWPSVGKLADKTEIAERTVQYKLRDLETLGLIVCVEPGGKGAKSTNEYKFDLQLLHDLAVGNVLIEENKGAPDAPCEGAPHAPLVLTRVHATTIRVQPTTNKGAPGAPEPSLNHQEPSAPARASDEARTLGARHLPKFDLTPSDASWAHWMTWLTDKGSRDLVVAAEAAGHITTHSRWPNEKSALPKVDARAAIERRKLGESAA